LRVSVARRNLFSDITRLLISVGGVAVAILLIIVLLAVYNGSLRQMSAYVDNVDADLWVAQAGSPDMLHSFSVVPASLIGELEKVEGVSEVWPLTSRTTLVDINGKKNSLILVGYQPGGIGGPWKMEEGSSDPGQGGMVADKVTMKTNGLKLGDSIEADGILYNERIVHHEKVMDPVCGMEMEMQDAVYTYTHGGRVYYFSSEECRHSFMEEPDKYS